MIRTDATPADLSDAILQAPAWARVGITVRDDRLRERAAEALVCAVLDRLNDNEPVNDPKQLALPI